ncbi:MAG: undecaprenyl-diphosphatase UppP [Gemmataceae bacterium]|nr:undecaprenyl-diphosphatase UppP [Gemmataceae bacterium]
MGALEAVVLGIVQGATEFLPISSTAHLRIVPALLGWKDPGAAFTAVTQWGTLVAALIYFRHDVGRILSGFFGLSRAQPFHGPDAQPGWQIIAATVPIVVFGILLRRPIKEDFRSLYVIAGAMAGLALVLLVAEWRYRKRDPAGLTTDLGKVTWAQALIVGFAQALALVPGASRSGVTITASLFAGFDRATAARFSFLLSLPAVFGAGLYELVKDREELLATPDSAGTLLLATVVAGLVGYASIAFLMRLLKKSSLAGFIAYRLALGIAIVALLRAGLLKD